MSNAVKVHESLIRSHPNPTKIGSLWTSLTRFAVDSAVKDSIKGVTGLKKLYMIVQERLTDISTQCPLNSPTKPEGLDSVKTMEMRMEEMQEDMSKPKQLNTSAPQLEEKEAGKKKPNESLGRSDVLNTDKKRIFIRSRL